EPNALIDSLETEDTVPVQDVVDSPQVYDDREIIVRGQIDKWITKRLFYLEVNDLTIVEKGLLVYSDTEYAPPQNAEEDELSLGSTPVVEIKGTLKDYSDDELRTLFDSEIDESEFDLYDNMPVLFMTSLTIIE
ncbi:MAG: hypothetical protein WAU07_00235, partial [Microgenomates group bacterium]